MVCSLTRWRRLQLSIGLILLVSRPHLRADMLESSSGAGLRRTPLVDAVARAMPSVVNIHGRKTIGGTGLAPGEGPRQVNGMGTGVVIDERGYILTNYHVIDGVRPIQVTLSDGRTYPARLIGRDTQTDLAVIQIRTLEPLRPITIGTSADLMLAEPVIAIGNAYGYHGTITRGIISALNRTVEVTDSQKYFDLIQTDASINPGNSGGPLLNVEGEMIAINVAVRVGADGIAFSIPVDRAVDVAASLLATDQTRGTWHGLHGKSRRVDGEWQFIVDRIADDSPAAICGLRAGDRILRIGNQVIERQLDVERAFLSVAPGSKIEIEVDRKNQSIPIQLVVATIPEAATSPDTEHLVWNRLGLRVVPVDPEVMEALKGKYNGGLRITAVRRDGLAARHGIQVGDVVVGMLEWETVSLTDLEYILDKLDQNPSSVVPFYVVRRQGTRVEHFNLLLR